MANKRWLCTAVSASAVAAVVGLSACGSSGNGNTATSGGGASTTGSAAPAVQFTSVEQNVAESYPEPKPGKFHLAYLNPVGGNEFLHTLGEAMRLETKKLGGTYTELDAKGDVNTQVSQFDQLIAQKEARG